MYDCISEDPLSPATVALGLSVLGGAIEGIGQDNEAVVYVLFNNSTRYIGKALLHRAKGKNGIPSRIMEHFMSILRKGAPSSRSVRAILFRQKPANSIGFLVAKRGPHDWIKASESVVIRNLRRNGNAGQCPGRERRRARGRGRPPQRFRHRQRFSFWSAAGHPSRIMKQVNLSRGRAAGLQAPLWTVNSFTDAYRRAQQELFAKSGTAGPVNIYSSRRGGLLALWACSKNSVLSLRLLFKGRSPQNAVVRLAALVQMVEGYVRQSRGFEHVDRLLHRLRMPKRGLSWFKSPLPEILRAAKKAVRRVALRMAMKHGSFMFSWIMKRSRFVLTGLPRCSEHRNHVQVAKHIDVSDICKSGCFAIEGHRRGEQVKRLPGNWAVPDRQKTKDSWRTMSSELENWCRRQNLDRRASKECRNALLTGSRRRGCFDTVPVEEERYVSDMFRSCDEVIVPDDKDKRRSWSMPSACLAAVLVSLVLLDRERWEVCDLTRGN